MARTATSAKTTTSAKNTSGKPAAKASQDFPKKATNLKEIAARRAANMSKEKEEQKAPEQAPSGQNGNGNGQEPPQMPALHISIGTLVSAITSAAISYKYALQMELSVGLAVFAQLGTDREAKRHLSKVYQQSGYDCEDMNAPEYKTVQRRIGAAADLFTWLEKTVGEGSVKSWMENSAEMASIQAIAARLEQYNLKGINSVLALVGKPVVLKRENTKPAEAPEQGQKPADVNVAEHTRSAPSKGGDEIPEEHKGAMQALQETVELNRRAEDVEGSVLVETEHLKLSIPPTISKGELIELAQMLLQMATELEFADADTAVVH